MHKKTLMLFLVPSVFLILCLGAQYFLENNIHLRSVSPQNKLHTGSHKISLTFSKPVSWVSESNIKKPSVTSNIMGIAPIANLQEQEQEKNKRLKYIKVDSTDDRPYGEVPTNNEYDDQDYIPPIEGQTKLTRKQAVKTLLDNLPPSLDPAEN